MSCQYDDDPVAATRGIAEKVYGEFLRDVQDWPSFYAWLEKVFVAREMARLLTPCETCEAALNTVVKHSYYAYLKTRQVTAFDISFYGFRVAFIDEFHGNVMSNIAFITKEKKHETR